MHSLTAAAVLAFVMLSQINAASAEAQQVVSAVERTEAAQSLAAEAVVHLKRGEDALSPEKKLAEYQEGLRLAKRALAIDDNNADAHFAVFGNEGRILLLQGATPNPINLLKVNRELDRALEIDPNHADALAAKGGLYRQLPWVLGGSLEKAEECLTRSLQLDPESVGARIELARVYRDKGQPERGVPLLEEACVLAERKNRMRYLGEAKELLGEIRDAAPPPQTN